MLQQYAENGQAGIYPCGLCQLFSALQRDTITICPGMNCTVLYTGGGFCHFEILQGEKCFNKHMLVMQNLPTCFPLSMIVHEQ